MTKVTLDILRFTGDHYQFGYEQGKQLKGSFLMSQRQQQFNKRKTTHFLTDSDEALSLLKVIHSPLINEIYGLKDALEIDIDEAIRHFAGYYQEVAKSGCSIMSGTDYFVRNYDSHPDSYEGRFVIYQPTDGGYRSMGPSMQITGRTDGINEKGLIVGYNFTNRRHSGDGFICNMIARILLEKASDVDEAFNILKSIPHRRSFSYVLKDLSGDSIVVEASPRDVVKRHAHMCTNHFELLKEDNRYQYDESSERLRKIKQAWYPQLSMIRAYQTFNGRKTAIFSNDYQYSSGTLHTIVYNPKARTALVGVGRQEQPVAIHLNETHSAPKVYVKKIRGVINWPRPYLNDRG